MRRKKTKAELDEELKLERLAELEESLNDYFLHNKPKLTSGHMIWKDRFAGKLHFESEWPEVPEDLASYYYDTCYVPNRFAEVEIAYKKCKGTGKPLPLLPRDERVIDMIYFTPIGKQLARMRIPGWEKIEILVPDKLTAELFTINLSYFYEKEDAAINLDRVKPTHISSENFQRTAAIYYTQNERDLPDYIREMVERTAVLVSVIVGDKKPYKRVGWKQAKITEKFLNRLDDFAKISKLHHLYYNSFIRDVLFPYEYRIKGLEKESYYKKTHIDDLWFQTKEHFKSKESLEKKLRNNCWTVENDYWESPNSSLI